MTSGLHGLDSTLVTLVAVVLLFAVGVLRRKDFGAIDVTTLVFLTAAFSIGGVMQACGAADKVFSLFRNVFPPALSLRYLLTMIAICMVLHLILGSNTTTLSVVVPGLILLCGRQVPQPVIVYAAILSVSFHAILPFHSVAMMIGASDGHFPPGYVTRFAFRPHCWSMLWRRRSISPIGTSSACCKPPDRKRSTPGERHPIC